jgi:zinc protease
MIRLGLCAVLATACAKPTTTTPTTPTTPTTVAPIDWSASGIDWSTPPAAGPEATYHPPRASEFTLPNGLRVILVEEHRLPLVSASLVIDRAGSAYDPPGKIGLAALTADLLDEGLSSLDSLALARELERLGASVRTFAQTDGAVISIDTLADTSAEALGLLVSMATSPTLLAADVNRVRGDRVSNLQRRRDRPRAVAALVFDRVLFGSHPYAQPGDGYAESVATLTVDDVRDFYRSHYGAGSATLVVAGDITTDALRLLLTPTLGVWPTLATAPAVVAKPDTQVSPPKLVVVDNPEATQTVLMLGRVSMVRSDPRFTHGEVANTILGGSFSSRLNRRLREQLGYTYGAGSSFWTGAAAGTFRVSTALQVQNTTDGIREALTLIESMRAADVAAEELARARSLLVRELPRNFDTNRSIVDTLAGLISDGLALDYFDALPAQVGAVDTAGVRGFGTEHWDTSGLVMVVVGDLEKILGGVLDLARERGVSSALELDTEGTVVRTHVPRSP